NATAATSERRHNRAPAPSPRQRVHAARSRTEINRSPLYCLAVAAWSVTLRARASTGTIHAATASPNNRQATAANSGSASRAARRVVRDRRDIIHPVLLGDDGNRPGGRPIDHSLGGRRGIHDPLERGIAVRHVDHLLGGAGGPRGLPGLQRLLDRLEQGLVPG